MNTNSIKGECATCGAPASVRGIDVLPQFFSDRKLYLLPKIEYSIIDNGCEHTVKFEGEVRYGQ
jgi:hypothetical protein